MFYVPDILTNLELPEQETLHCIRVLRKQLGDKIDITDGKGHIYKAQIEDIHNKYCKVKIVEAIKTIPLWKNRIEIAIAPTKNTERIEWLAEKVTEIGINKISFLRTHYSERKELKTNRIRKIMISAMKQSGQTFLPELQEMITLKQFVQQNFKGQKFIAHCYSTNEKILLSKIYNKNEDVVVLIGPEGDFSKDEVNLASANGFRTISLGNTRLRTETAALITCQTIHIINQ